MATLIATRGLPASGKTTHARAWVDADRAQRARVNRDDLRLMLDHGVFEKGVTEGRVLAARDSLILGLLGRGLDVICDDTNLPQRTIRDLAALAKRAGATLLVEDFTDVPLEECLRRDAARTDKAPVGESVIRDMHARYLRGRSLPLPLPEEGDPPLTAARYVPIPGTPTAILVDIDGTVALHGTRSPFDETRVHEDRPNRPVIRAVVAMCVANHALIFMSGRSESCRAATEDWLRRHVSPAWDGLYMRAAGDFRKDSVVKAELFDRHVRDRWDVQAVFDDRDQVVRMWRDLGLTVFQVADGNF